MVLLPPFFQGSISLTIRLPFWQLVYYHSGGLRLNPNLYDSGKVCLSLLNTWSGDQNEKWIPGLSTMLQVLVSIQGLILNAKPFFNEPGFACMRGSVSGETRSLQYNENTFILSLKTMLYSMKKPPKVKLHYEFLSGVLCDSGPINCHLLVEIDIKHQT